MTASNRNSPSGENVSEEQLRVKCYDCEAEWSVDAELEELVECPECGARFECFEVRMRYLETTGRRRVVVTVEVPEELREIGELRERRYGVDLCLTILENVDVQVTMDGVDGCVVGS